jgi:adenine-specific DNA methylase
VSNTQGTYHDFPRDYVDPRALQPLTLDYPPLDAVLVGGNHFLGKEEDSLEFIRRAPEHDVLYVDPPYNFRQYTSYYFMPNMICRYPEIEELDDYFAKIQYVRGQNMDDDFSSTFCSKTQFLPSLDRLISRANTRFVILSYFDGRNHWNEFKTRSDGVGRAQVQELFNSSRFLPSSMRVIPICRSNYQSYGGYKARDVNEYLFIAEKA